MEKKSVFTEFFSWLKSSEMFARPVKRLPGKWQLFEYYRDLEDGLHHAHEEQLKKSGENWTIEFFEDEKLAHQKNMTIPIIAKIENGDWNISKNYITFLHPSEFRNHIEFQFAVEKNILKLLKKDNFGKIEFFGFFKKMVEK